MWNCERWNSRLPKHSLRTYAANSRLEMASLASASILDTNTLPQIAFISSMTRISSGSSWSRTTRQAPRQPLHARTWRNSIPRYNASKLSFWFIRFSSSSTSSTKCGGIGAPSRWCRHTQSSIQRTRRSHTLRLTPRPRAPHVHVAVHQRHQRAADLQEELRVVGEAARRHVLQQPLAVSTDTRSDE